MFLGHVGMERLNGDVDEKNLGVRRFMDKTNLVFVSLFGISFHEA